MSLVLPAPAPAPRVPASRRMLAPWVAAPVRSPRVQVGSWWAEQAPPAAPVPRVPDRGASRWQKRVERVPPRGNPSGARWLRSRPPVMVVVRDWAPSSAPRLQRHAWMAMLWKPSPRPRWTRPSPWVPVSPDVARPVRTQTAMQALARPYVSRAESMEDWSVSQDRPMLRPPPRAGMGPKRALSRLAEPGSRKRRRGLAQPTLRRNPPARARPRAVHGCAASAPPPPATAPLHLSRSSGRLLPPRPACAAYAVSAAVSATWRQPRRACCGCAALQPVAAFRRRRCPALRSSCSLRECSRPRSRCSVRAAHPRW